MNPLDVAQVLEDILYRPLSGCIGLVCELMKPIVVDSIDQVYALLKSICYFDVIGEQNVAVVILWQGMYMGSLHRLGLIQGEHVI